MKAEHFPSTQDIKYKQIYGALAWPGKRPGFIVIVGELKQPGAVKYVLLDEKEDGDTAELIRVAGALDFFFKPERWVSDTENKAGMKLLQEFNATLDPRAGSRRLRLVPSRLLALKDEVFAYLYPRLKRMAGENGSLDISRGAKLLGYLAALQESDIGQATWGDFPAIEALTFCVFGLDRAPAIVSTGKAKHETVKF